MEGWFTEDGGIEWHTEFREDDLIDAGYCPQCGRELRDISVAGKGFCSVHKWVFADWTAPKNTEESEDE